MKNQVLVGLFFAALLISMSFVSASAAGDAIRNTAQIVSDIVSAVFDAVSPAFSAILGPQSEEGVGRGTDSYMVAEALLLLIVFSLVFVIVDSIEFFDQHRWTIYIISAAVSVLSVRFLTEGWINSILLPYQALGITLTAALPFIIYFYFVEVKLQHRSSGFRKVLWCLFAVVWIFLYATRYDEIRTFAWIYLAAFGLSVLMLWMDGTVQRFLLTGKVTRMQTEAKEEIIMQHRRNLAQANLDFTNRAISRTEWETRVRRIKAEIDRIARSP